MQTTSDVFHGKKWNVTDLSWNVAHNTGVGGKVETAVLQMIAHLHFRFVVCLVREDSAEYSWRRPHRTLPNINNIYQFLVVIFPEKSRGER